jgi:hypothetical protein
MPVLDPTSLSRTVDLVNAAAFYGELPTKTEAAAASALIASRFGAVRYLRAECERRLTGPRRSTEVGKRRALVLGRVLEKHG